MVFAVSQEAALSWVTVPLKRGSKLCQSSSGGLSCSAKPRGARSVGSSIALSSSSTLQH